MYFSEHVAHQHCRRKIYFNVYVANPPYRREMHTSITGGRYTSTLSRNTSIIGCAWHFGIIGGRRTSTLSRHTSIIGCMWKTSIIGGRCTSTYSWYTSITQDALQRTHGTPSLQDEDILQRVPGKTGDLLQCNTDTPA